MREEKPSVPFSELSYQEQQDRWLEWRSRQLAFREGSVSEENAAYKEPAAAKAAPVKLPNYSQSAPTRHQNLDQVLSRMVQAEKRAGTFQATKRNG